MSAFRFTAVADGPLAPVAFKASADGRAFAKEQNSATADWKAVMEALKGI